MNPHSGLEGTESKADKRRILAYKIKKEREMAGETGPRYARVEVEDVELFHQKIVENNWTRLITIQNVVLMSNVTEEILDDFEKDDNVKDFLEIATIPKAWLADIEKNKEAN